MSLLLIRPSAGAAPAPSAEPSFPPVPTLYARVAWRPEDIASGLMFTALPWDGSTTTGWITAGTAISGPVASLDTTESDSFGGDSSLEMVTNGTAASGVDYRIVGTFTSGRTYRARAGVKNISGSTSLVLRAGHTADAGTATHTIDGGWDWYTVDWTPSTTFGTAWVSLRNGAAATQTTRLDHVELYEALDDVTLESLSISRGSRFDGGGEAPGSMDFTILDPLDRYTPRNSASPLSGAVNPGRRVHIRATYEGRLYPVAYGVIRTVTPDPFTKTVAFTAEDGLAELDGYTIAKPFSATKSYRTARIEALTDEAITSDQYLLTTGSIENNTFYDGTDAEVSVLDYLDSLNQATGTVHWCQPHVEARRGWRYRVLTRSNITNDVAGQSIDEDFQTLSGVDAREESFITRQRVRWQGYEHHPSQVVVEATQEVPYWTFTSEEYGSSDTPQPEDIFRLKRAKGRKRRRRRKLRRVGSRWVDAILPVEIADGASYTFSVDFACPMTIDSVDVTATGGSTSVTTDAEPSHLNITVTATGALTVTDVSVTARAYVPIEEADEVMETPGATFVREAPEIDNEYVPAGGGAQGLAGYLTWRYGTARLRPDVKDQHQPTRQLTLDIGSHVTLSADRWYIDADRYVVRSIEHDISHAGLVWETTYGLEELPGGGGDWVTLNNVSAGLDTSAVLAY